MTDQLELRYVPLGSIAYWDANAKKHDIGAIARSICKYGFLDPPKWDTNLNGGLGGIAEGNGRKEALERLIGQGLEPPRGIVVKDGQWLIPVLFGVDAASEAQAQAYGLDHNTLTMMGGEFSAIDLSKMYEQEDYLDLLKSLADDDALPVSVDGDDLDFLIEQFARDDDLPIPSDNKNIDEDALSETNCECPSCGFKWKK
jgi:hypothetical protein